MKKIILGILVALLISVLFVSCVSSSEYHEQMLPSFNVSIPAELLYDQYDFIGNVTGSASYTLEGDWSSVYSSYVGILDTSGAGEALYDSNVDKAIKEAVYEMTKKAKQLNANMFILPSYSLDYEVKEDLSGAHFSTTVVTVSVSAVAVKLLDKSGNSLEVY